MDRSDDGNVHVTLNMEQESEPPRTVLAVVVAIGLLEDLRDWMDGDREDGVDADLLLRTAAVLAVLRRVRERLED